MSSHNTSGNERHDPGSSHAGSSHSAHPGIQALSGAPSPAHEATAIKYMEKELRTIRTRFENGHMQAFGRNQGKVLKEIEWIRQNQVHLALEHMGLEITSRIPAATDEDFDEFKEKEFEQVSSTFVERERAIARLSTKLHHLSKSIDSVNTLSGGGSSAM